MVPNNPMPESPENVDLEMDSDQVDIDLDALAEVVAALLLRELAIEVERTGR
jgi:hypothetical protein